MGVPGRAHRGDRHGRPALGVQVCVCVCVWGGGGAHGELAFMQSGTVVHRYILDRVCEDFGVIATLDPKPMPGIVHTLPG